MHVCVGGCVSPAGCDGMITLRPDGWVMLSCVGDSCSLLFSAHSRPHLKTKNTRRLRYQTLLDSHSWVKITHEPTTEFKNTTCAFSHGETSLHNSVHVPITLISVESESSSKRAVISTNYAQGLESECCFC